MTQRVALRLSLVLLAGMVLGQAVIPAPVLATDSESVARIANPGDTATAPTTTPVSPSDSAGQPTNHHAAPAVDYWSLLFVLGLSTLLGLGAIVKVSRLLHTPLMSLTNAISAIAVVGAIVVAGQDHPPVIVFLGAVALFASMTNIVSGFLITDRMLKMFKKDKGGRG